VCSTAFEALGHAQARALGCPTLPIARVPHPFGLRTRAELRGIAKDVAAQVAALVCGDTVAETEDSAQRVEIDRVPRIAAPADIETFYALARERRWTDGLPLIPPTVERVERMLAHTERNRYDVIARVAPAFGAATVERIAANAVMAGCAPDAIDLLIAAVDAMSAPELNLQGMQATTNPAALWLIVNGPVAERLGVNNGPNCLGQGAWANATLGRALRLVMQNIGGAQPGEMDRATQGQPGKYSMCCAEIEREGGWEPLHVERGYARGESTVTLVGFA
jgi:hypothetical protein